MFIAITVCNVSSYSPGLLFCVTHLWPDAVRARSTAGESSYRVSRPSSLVCCRLDHLFRLQDSRAALRPWAPQCVSRTLICLKTFTLWPPVVCRDRSNCSNSSVGIHCTHGERHCFEKCSSSDLIFFPSVKSLQAVRDVNVNHISISKKVIIPSSCSLHCHVFICIPWTSALSSSPTLWRLCIQLAPVPAA